MSPSVSCLTVLAAALAVAGCSAPATADGTGADTAQATPDDTGTGGTGATWPDETADVPEPSPGWDADAVAAALDDAISRGLPNFFEARDAYLDLMAQGDAVCPGDTEQITDDHVTGCSASTGYAYAGVSQYASLDGTDAEAEGWTTYEVLAGDFSIHTPEGEGFRVGGGSSWAVLDAGTGPRAWEMLFYGSWVDERRSDWLGSDASAILQAAGEDDRFSAFGGWASGGVEVFTPELVVDLDACPHPLGELRVRGEDTWWYAWTVDSCSTTACGAVTFQDGTALGEISRDLEQLLDHFLPLREWPE